MLKPKTSKFSSIYFKLFIFFLSWEYCFWKMKAPLSEERYIWSIYQNSWNKIISQKSLQNLARSICRLNIFRNLLQLRPSKIWYFSRTKYIIISTVAEKTEIMELFIIINEQLVINHRGFVMHQSIATQHELQIIFLSILTFT